MVYWYFVQTYLFCSQKLLKKAKDEAFQPESQVTLQATLGWNMKAGVG